MLTPVALGTLYVLLWCPPALAVNPSLDVSQYAHTAWTYRDGFVQGAVNAIAQTPDGYLWLATQSGVVRFDGVRTVPLPLAPGQRLPNTSVGALLAARDGTLWIGTLDGLVSWKKGHLTEYPSLARRTVLALLQDRAGTVWVGGLAGPAGTLCAIRGDGPTCYGDDGSLGTVVASLYEDIDGSIWVGAATGLWQWTPGPPTRYLATPISRGGKMTQGDHGAGLVVAVGGVRRIIGKTVTDYPLHGVPLPLSAGTVLRDRNGGLWIGTTAHGLVHSHEGKTSTFTHNDGLSSDQVYALFEGTEGSIWVATSEGLDQFRELPVTSLPVKQGSSSPTTNSVLAARDGSIWIATAGGLYAWDRGRTTVYRRRSNSGLADDEIQSLFEDARGRIWVSSFSGLAAFWKGKFTALPSVPAGTKNAITGDNHGGLWLSLFGTANNYSLTHLVDGKITEQVPWRDLGGGPGTGLVPDPNGGIWTGLLSGGIAYFRAGQTRYLPLSDDGAGARKVLDISRDRSGTLWAATENGVSRITNTGVATLTTANGLPCKAVHWIIEDDLSSHWLYTPCGLLRITRTALEAWIADPKRSIQATTFDAADGVRLVPILKGLRPAVTKASDGKIWFVNGDGVSFIDPSRIRTNTLPPPVHVEQVTVDGKTYDAGQDLRLPPHVRNLLIDYTALSLVAPDRVRFRVMLEGQDRVWRELGNQRHVQYTNLPPRKYRFRVIASNNSGVWNETGASLVLSIAPAYYQTIWFRALAAAALAALLWGAYRTRMRIVERHAAEISALNERLMSAQEEERTRIAGELHDSVMQQISALSLVLGTAKRKMAADSEAKEMVAEVQRKLIDVGTELRQLSHDLHPPELRQMGLPEVLRGYCDSFGQAHGIPVSCEVEASVADLSEGTGLALYRIAQEALGNAAKHAAPTRVDVRLARVGGDVVLTVADDGRGRDPEQVDTGGLGLVNMRERARQMNGTFELDSRPGRGTTVRVAVPLRAPEASHAKGD